MPPASGTYVMVENVQSGGPARARHATPKPMRIATTLALSAGLALCAGPVAHAAGEHERWALLAAGSNTYPNYRFQADVAHAYQRVVAGGVPKENVVSLMYDDVAHDDFRNPYPGELFNFPTGQAKGTDVNRGFNKTFTGEGVTKAAFLSALTCSDPKQPCVASTSPDATLFVFWSGHGEQGMLFLPPNNAATALYTDELVKALSEARTGNSSGGRSKGFASILVVVEACNSGSMFAGALADGVYAITAARADENSYPAYCCVFHRPPSCTVGGNDIGSCLGDLFATSVLEQADKESSGSMTLDQVYEDAKAKTRPADGNPGSEVQRFGDMSLSKQPMSTYIGDPAHPPQRNARSSDFPFFRALPIPSPEHQSKFDMEHAFASAFAAHIFGQNIAAPSFLAVQDSQSEHFSCYRTLAGHVDE
eukprot:gene2603-3305_t